jgi:hypothetical protein
MHWIVAYEPRRSTGFRLSLMMGQWVIGPLQAWEFHERWNRFIERREDLYAARPRCRMSNPGSE